MSSVDAMNLRFIRILMRGIKIPFFHSNGSARVQSIRWRLTEKFRLVITEEGEFELICTFWKLWTIKTLKLVQGSQ